MRKRKMLPDKGEEREKYKFRTLGSPTLDNNP